MLNALVDVTGLFPADLSSQESFPRRFLSAMSFPRLYFLRYFLLDKEIN